MPRVMSSVWTSKGNATWSNFSLSRQSTSLTTSSRGEPARSSNVWVIVDERNERDTTIRTISGPFATWEHLHTFQPVDDHTTLVIDQVTATFHKKWFWKAVGMSMWAGLPLLFAYRAWRTRTLLARTAATPLPTTQ